MAKFRRAKQARQGKRRRKKARKRAKLILAERMNEQEAAHRAFSIK
jgi:hypothetical protein